MWSIMKQKIIPAEKYAYVFVEFKDNVESLKIYQPFSEFYKWRNKHDSSVWDLWEQLPETGEKFDNYFLQKRCFVFMG